MKIDWIELKNSVSTHSKLSTTERNFSPTKNSLKRSSSSNMEVLEFSGKVLRPSSNTSPAQNGSEMLTITEGSLHDVGDSVHGVSRSLLEMKAAFKTPAQTKESITNGQFLNLVFYRPSTDSGVAEHRKGKKQLIIDALTHLVLDSCDIKLPQTAQDTLMALYDSADDLILLALANLAIAGGLQLPKALEQSVVELMQAVDTGAATDEMQLLSASIVMCRAIAAAPRELSTLLTHACGLLVKNNGNKETPLHMPALLCLRSYLRNARVIGGSLPPEMLNGSGLVEKFCLKMMKHRPAPMSREAVSFLKVISSSSYANVIRQHFKNCNNDDKECQPFDSILQATAVKFPTDTLEMCGKVFSISPKEAIPLRLLTSIIDTLIKSRGNEVIVEVIRFCLSCLEASMLLLEFFGHPIDEENEPDQHEKCVPLIDVYQGLKADHNPSVIWPAAALRFIRHPLVEEALADGSLHHYIDEGLRNGSGDDKTVAMLLLCPEQQSLRLSVDSKMLSAEPVLPDTVSCANCIKAEVKSIASEAAREAATRGLTSALIRLRGQEETVSKMRLQVARESLESSRRIAEAKSLQAQICATEKQVEELRSALGQCEERLAEQKTRNEETMTALKQSRRDVEKSRSEGEKKRAECQNLQRELIVTKEQLLSAKKKIDDLELFKDKLNCFMASFPSK